MDELVEACINEVILEGDNGCSLFQLWNLVEARYNHSNSPTIQESVQITNFDEKTKQYVFNLLVTSSDIIATYKNNRVTDASRFLAFDFEFATQCELLCSKAQLETIYDDLEAIGRTEICCSIYLAIIQSRYQGISQLKLASKFNLDSKAVFHHLKRIKTCNLISSIPWLESKHVTNLYFHNQFLEESHVYNAYIAKIKTDFDVVNQSVETHYHDVSLKQIYITPKDFADRLYSLLSSAKNNIMERTDIFTALNIDYKNISTRKVCDKLLRILWHLGYIEAVRTISNEDEDQKKLKCYVLKKMFGSEVFQSTANSFDWNNMPAIEKIGLALDLPLENQIYNAITSAGREGISRVKLREALPGIKNKTMVRILEMFSKVKNPSLISTISKLHGKSRYFCYVAAELKSKIIAPHPNLSTAQKVSKKYKTAANNQTASDIIILDENKKNVCLFCLKKLNNQTSYCNRSCELDYNDLEIFKKLKKQGAKYLTIDNIRRDRVILQMIEHEKALDVTKSTIVSFQKQLRMDHPDSQPLISDLKSLRKVFSSLHESGKIKLMETSISMVNGKQRLVTVGYHNSLEPDSPEIFEFLKKIQHDAFFKSSTYTAAKTKEIIDLEVERLPQDTIENLAEKQADFFDDTLATKLKYGYVGSKNGALVLFHRWLLDFSSKRLENIVESFSIFQKIPAEIILKIIPYDCNPILDEFVKDPVNLKMEARDFPKDIRGILLQKATLKTFLEINIGYLEVLGFIQPIFLKREDVGDEVADRHVAHSYRILRVVTLRAYEDPASIELDTYNITRNDDFKRMWSKLEFHCLSVIDISKTIAIPPQFKFLFIGQRWKSNFKFTDEQKQILNQYVERDTGCTPLKNENLCSSLAFKLNISVTRVKYYFTKMENAFERRRGKRRREVVNEVNEDGEFLLSSVKSKKVKTEQKSEKQKGAIRARRSWTSEEDDLILCADVVLGMYMRLGRRSTSWFANIFPGLNLTSDSIRRRGCLLKKQDGSKRYKALKLAWEQFTSYSNEMNLSLEYDYVAEHFLQVILEFQRFSNTLGSYARSSSHIDVPMIELPETIALIKEKYEINDILMVDETLYTSMDIGLRSYYSRTSKFSYLQNMGNYFPINRYIKNDLLLEEWMKINKILSLIKTILITPNEKYNPSNAWLALTQYEESDVTKALGILHQTETIIRSSKTSQLERKVPGKAFHLSGQFLETLKGPFPEKIFVNAIRFWKKIHHGFETVSTFPLPVVKDEGMMMVLSEILCSDDYRFDLEIPRNGHGDREPWIKCAISQVSKTESLLKRKSEDNQTGMVLKNHIWETLITPDFPTIYNKIKVSVSTLQKVYATISESKEIGCELEDLQKVLDEPMKLSVLKCILGELLKQNVILQVRFSIPRYILLQYAPHWYVSLIVNGVRGELITPRLWTCLNGSKSESMYRACSEVVLSNIIIKPGIEKENLIQTLQGIMNEDEVVIIIEDLLEKGAITTETFCKPKPIHSVFESLFSNPSIILDSVNLQELTVQDYDHKSLLSVYYPAPNYLTKIAQ